MATIEMPEDVAIIQSLRDEAHEHRSNAGKNIASLALDDNAFGYAVGTARCGLQHLPEVLKGLKNDSVLHLKIHEGDAPFAQVEMNGTLRRRRLGVSWFWEWSFVTRVYLDITAPLAVMSERFGRPWRVMAIHYGSEKELNGWVHLLALWRSK